MADYIHTILSKAPTGLCEGWRSATSLQHPASTITAQLEGPCAEMLGISQHPLALGCLPQGTNAAPVLGRQA